MLAVLSARQILTSDRAILAYNVKLKRTRNKSALRSFRHLTSERVPDVLAKAEAFERYLKSGSGHAFARKRLW